VHTAPVLAENEEDIHQAMGGDNRKESVGDLADQPHPTTTGDSRILIQVTDGHGVS
jgi:hypothetical protein